MKKLLCQAGALCILAALTACGGSKILKEPEPMIDMQPLAVASDQKLAVALDWVIVRDGAGTWSRKADWDEYLLRVRNDSDRPIRVTRLTVVDSLGAPTESVAERKKLVQGSKNTARRYKKSGIEVKAGSGRRVLRTAGLTVGGAALGAASVAGTGWGGAAAVAGGALVLAPVLAVGGVMRGVNQSKVNSQIELRQTELPLSLEKGQELALDMFFPIAPSPKTVVLTYADAAGEHRIVIDTSAALDGLHIVTAGE